LNSKKPKIVLFSDLDGTFLDEKYDFQMSKSTISRLIDLNVPIVFCSSKTQAEIEVYRKELGVKDPFVSENGSAILIPRGYFPFDYAFAKRTSKYDIVELGIDYSAVRKALKRVSEASGSEIVGFGDMTAEEIAAECGLPLRSAKLAKERRYDEAFKIVAGEEKEVLNLIVKEGFNFTRGGRYFHILGKTDKGKAVKLLKALYVRKSGKLLTFGVGDGQNDLPMLNEVDAPFFMKETDGKNDRQSLWKQILNQINRSIHSNG
jgi:mannosyl-3-phosphoglycerate phosphatase